MVAKVNLFWSIPCDVPKRVNKTAYCDSDMFHGGECLRLDDWALMLYWFIFSWCDLLALSTPPSDLKWFLHLNLSEPPEGNWNNTCLVGVARPIFWCWLVLRSLMCCSSHQTISWILTALTTNVSTYVKYVNTYACQNYLCKIVVLCISNSTCQKLLWYRENIYLNYSS